MDKKTLRQLGRVNARETKETHGPEYDQQIADRFFSTQYFMPRTNVSAFISLKGEVSCTPIIKRLEQAGHIICLPVVTAANEPMLFRRYHSGDPTRSGIFGQQEPFPYQEEVIPDVLLVPMLGFNRQGYRLGYGSGFYDRTLTALRAIKPVKAIGIAYSAQEMNNLIIEPHDEPMNTIITEKEAIILS